MTMITLLFAFAVLLPPQSDASRQQQDIQQMQRQLETQQNEVIRLLSALEKQSGKPVCEAQLEMLNNPAQRSAPATSTAVVPLNLVATVSKPASPCHQAEIRLNVSYLNSANQVVCS